MKKFILTGLSFLFAITMLFAQEINPETKAKDVVVTLTEKLSLTEDQQVAIYPIELEKMKAKIALQADTTIAEDVKKQQIEVLKQTANEKIKEQLNDDQKVLFDKYLEEKSSKKEEETVTA